MLVAITLAAAVVGSAAIALVVLLHKLASPARCELVSTEWLSRFSVTKYRPMERLFSEEDYEYLSGLTGYHPGIARQLRRARGEVFRGYLRCLRSDYRRLEAAITLYMANCPVDRPDLAKALLKRRLQFNCAVLAAECAVRFRGAGLSPANTHRLIDALDEMRLHLRRQALLRQAALA